MKVLVIDDKTENKKSAEETLKAMGHSVTVMDDCEMAYAFLLKHGRDCQFDAVLTDLWMPGPSGTSAFGVGQAKNCVSVPMPVGMMFALMAINLGVKIVAIVTDMSHHCDPLTAGLEKIEALGTRILCYNSQTNHTEEGAKDWGNILNHIIVYIPEQA
ncbi:MAG: response regulator [Candidatus Magasanikbacteria bacterium]|nr:response regulator [Candidatus Magasanikbacteria bacterium]